MKCDKVFNDINFTCFQGRVAVDLVVPMTVPTVESPSILSLASTYTCSPTQVKSLMNVGFVANDLVGKETWGRIWLPPMLDFHWIRNDWMKYWSKGFSRKRKHDVAYFYPCRNFIGFLTIGGILKCFLRYWKFLHLWADHSTTERKHLVLFNNSHWILDYSSE